MTSTKYIKVVNGSNKKPRQGQIHPPNTLFHAIGRAIQIMSSMMREKAETNAVKQPELLFLIFDFSSQ